MERFDAQKILEVLHTKPITTFCAPPTMFKSMIQVQDSNLFKFHSLRYCVGGGEAVNAEVGKVWSQKTGLCGNGLRFNESFTDLFCTQG